MVLIPGLPDHLTVVPPAPSSPDDPDAEGKRVAFRRWRYDVQVWRTERTQLIKANPELIPVERELCARHPAYYAATQLRIFEPRWRVDPTAELPPLVPIGEDPDDPDAEIERMQRARFALPDVPLITTSAFRGAFGMADTDDPAMSPIFGYVPFICFEQQVEVMNRLLWTLHQTDENADAVWSKCRGWGASWIICLLADWGWTFSHLWPDAPPWNVLLLSRKEELVDSKQQRSLFWKIRRLQRDKPLWLQPAGWDPDHHDQKGILINPENGNEIGGESTNTKAGRGDRVTWAAPDEAAAMPNFLTIWSTLAETTDHRWAPSTESFDEHADFYEMGKGRRQSESEDPFPYLIESDWWQNPLNGQAWFERQKIRYGSDPDAFNREILRDPHAGTSTWVYPWAREKSSDPLIRPVIGWPSYVTADPGVRDPTALVAVQECPTNDHLNVLDSYSIEGKEADYFAPLLKPDLFAADDTNWMDKAWLRWTSPLDSLLTYEYDERAIAFARTVAAMGKPTYVGDTYGEVVTGATNDSVYSRWRKYGIFVNADRKTGDAVTRKVKVGRTFAGRREAMHERAKRWRFATTPGAKAAMKAVQSNKYKPAGDRLSQTEPREPLHDWSSHLTTALEFLAVRLGHRKAVTTREAAKPNKTSLGKLGKMGNMGTHRRNAPTTLRGLN